MQGLPGPPGPYRASRASQASGLEKSSLQTQIKLFHAKLKASSHPQTRLARLVLTLPDAKQAASSQTQPRDGTQGTLKTRGSSHPQTQTGTGLVWTRPPRSRLDCPGRLTLNKRKSLEPEPAQTVHPPGLDGCRAS